MSSKPRLFLAGLAVSSLVAAGVLTFVFPRHNGLGVDLDNSARAQEAQRRLPYDLHRARVLSLVAAKVADFYVDPTRIDYRKMMLAGLGAVQSRVAPVIVRMQPNAPSLTVQVGTATQDFQVADVTSHPTLSRRMGEVLGFIQDHLGDEDGIEPRDIEYAAINGMLRTLDPHSNLLPPEVFREMQTSQRGQFGGLGIVISIRDGHLTVIRPMQGTPASGAGIQRGDRIARINDESTMNMPLTEAVSRLRGEPGEPVDVWISRRADGGTWADPRKFRLVRAVIHLESVEHEMLADHVGYIKINDFQGGNTSEEVTRALADLHAHDMRGLVLDLRGNPGGYLEQAIEIADLFLSNGAIVSTRSRSGGARDNVVRNAHAQGTEPDYPMAVLINNGSASASEIVAGALKNQDRALIVGQRSFGKGSVQQIYSFSDGSALKLTIAQYYTPGDVSIQGVGIVPDIAIDPMTVDREDLDIEIDTNEMHEADLRASLTNAAVQQGEQPSEVLRYYLPVDVRRRLREAAPEENEENEREAEFLTHFGQVLVARAHRTRRPLMLAEARPTLDQIRNEEMQKTITELQRLGVDWSVGADAGASTLEVTASTDAPEDTVTAGSTLKLRVRVRNTGTAPLFQLRAITKSDNPLFDQRELVFGRLGPGETREWSASLELCTTRDDVRDCRVPRWLTDRSDAIRIRFAEAHGHVPSESIVRTTVRALERPQFSYAVHVADDQQGDGDGRIEPGERGSVWLSVKNVGAGRTYRTIANLRNESGRGVLLREGRFTVETIEPSQERTIRFGFEILPDFRGDSVKLVVGVFDEDLREGISHDIVVPVSAQGGAAPSAREGVVRLAPRVVVRERPDARADVVARVAQASVLTAQAELDGFVRVDLGGGQPGWVALRDARRASGAPAPHVEMTMSERPPRVDLSAATQLVTRDATVRLVGRAFDDEHVRDVYVFSGARKVFYRAASGSNVRELALDAVVPLHDGMNFITIIVRESATATTQKTLVIRRDGPNGELLETPRFDDDWFAVGAGDD